MISRHHTFLFSTALAALTTLTLAGCGKPPDAQAPPAPDITVGTQVDDAVITSGIKSALMADPLVKGFDLQVETRKGVVQLSGFVDSQAQIDQATQIAAATEGASSVKSELLVKQ